MLIAIEYRVKSHQGKSGAHRLVDFSHRAKACVAYKQPAHMIYALRQKAFPKGVLIRRERG